ncbi:hypothetical protein WJX84_002826 [Apatococcus fuscideae]|uniref:Uncharacterized protein n=1 Tax=Apatococcus fuscideae TaxID=2026836 RepID=A0AAW1T1X5_9CHLO
MRKILQDAGGKLDVLVTNAGVLEQWRPFAETEPEEWWGTWEVNIRGSYLAARAATQSMLQRGQGGTIILISSAGSLRAKPGASAYQTTKLAINRLANFIHADHASQGIRAFAVHPGGVKTDLAYGMPQDMHHILVDSPYLSGAMCVWLGTDRADFLRGRSPSECWLSGFQQDMERDGSADVRP